MISRIPKPPTTKQDSVAALRNRIVPKILGHSETRHQSAGYHSNNRGPTSMSILQHLLCGCLGISFIILFMGMINIMINTLIQQSFNFSINELLWMFGQ